VRLYLVSRSELAYWDPRDWTEHGSHSAVGPHRTLSSGTTAASRHGAHHHYFTTPTSPQPPSPPGGKHSTVDNPSILLGRLPSVRHQHRQLVGQPASVADVQSVSKTAKKIYRGELRNSDRTLREVYCADYLHKRLDSDLNKLRSYAVILLTTTPKSVQTETNY
jgi:hypothetical protein